MIPIRLSAACVQSLGARLSGTSKDKAVKYLFENALRHNRNAAATALMTSCDAVSFLEYGAMILLSATEAERDSLKDVLFAHYEHDINALKDLLS